ncbi:uncharacterized protein LOC116776278 [Danaus plexippus]|uniref:uncharacterized protein LOC116776278 n=1 Tax=Danaus plexippus TaxID=13037 RepID=UPI002AB2D599|nr:uncharacterized protein LOC116776278 [Danaus plexippus]
MSTSKSSKAELVAIYRLEFYKKQNNWKLSSNRIKPPKKYVEKEILNTTYNVEDKQVIDKNDPLNVAFVESDCDKNQKFTFPKSPELSQEWQEPVNIWPENNVTDTIKTAKTIQRLANLQKAASLADLEDKNDVFTQNLATCSECQESRQVDEACCPQELILGWNDCGEFEGTWPMETAVFIGSGHVAPDVRTEVDNPSVHTDVVDGLQDICTSQYPPWAPSDPLQLAMDMDWDTSVDSAGEFMRGADMAPHSSEIDLSLPNCVKACDVSFTSLSRLSSQQLLQAAQQHSKVLKRLLMESETRQKLRSAQSLMMTSSYEEFPTRDVGPIGLCGQDVFFKDVLIAGSHRNLVGCGRGRGRLANNSFGLKPFSR